jgi:hypothetical protein
MPEASSAFRAVQTVLTIRSTRRPALRTRALSSDTLGPCPCIAIDLPPSYSSPHLTSLPQLERHSCPKRGVARNATAHLDTVCASHKRHGSSSGRSHVVIRRREKVNRLLAHVMDGPIPSCLTPPIHTRNGLMRRYLYAIFRTSI